MHAVPGVGRERQAAAITRTAAAVMLAERMALADGYYRGFLLSPSQYTMLPSM